MSIFFCKTNLTILHPGHQQYPLSLLFPFQSPLIQLPPRYFAIRTGVRIFDFSKELACLLSQTCMNSYYFRRNDLIYMHKYDIITAEILIAVIIWEFMPVRHFRLKPKRTWAITS